MRGARVNRREVLGAVGGLLLSARVPRAYAQTYDLIIKGGQVVTSWGVGDWDIAVQGEKIVGVAAPGTFHGRSWPRD